MLTNTGDRGSRGGALAVRLAAGLFLENEWRFPDAQPDTQYTRGLWSDLSQNN